MDRAHSRAKSTTDRVGLLARGCGEIMMDGFIPNCFIRACNELGGIDERWRGCRNAVGDDELLISRIVRNRARLFDLPPISSFQTDPLLTASFSVDHLPSEAAECFLRDRAEGIQVETAHSEWCYAIDKLCHTFQQGVMTWAVGRVANVYRSCAFRGPSSVTYRQL